MNYQTIRACYFFQPKISPLSPQRINSFFLMQTNYIPQNTQDFETLKWNVL